MDILQTAGFCGSFFVCLIVCCFLFCLFVFFSFFFFGGGGVVFIGICIKHRDQNLE